MAEITVWQAVILIIFSGIISIDRLAGLNIMLSRPIVVSGIVGLIFGNVVLALMIGIIFEFIGMLEVPVGTTIVHDDSFGGYTASILFASHIISADYMNILLAILILSLLIYPVTYTDKYYRKINMKILDRSIKKKEKNYEKKLIFIGLLMAFFRGIFVYNICLILVYIIIKFIDTNLNVTAFPVYDSSIAFSLTLLFMGLYLLDFLIINKIFKLIILSAGFVFGWLVI